MWIKNENHAPIFKAMSSAAHNRKCTSQKRRLWFRVNVLMQNKNDAVCTLQRNIIMRFSCRLLVWIGSGLKSWKFCERICKMYQDSCVNRNVCVSIKIGENCAWFIYIKWLTRSRGSFGFWQATSRYVHK